MPTPLHQFAINRSYADNCHSLNLNSKDSMGLHCVFCGVSRMGSAITFTQSPTSLKGSAIIQTVTCVKPTASQSILPEKHASKLTLNGRRSPGPLREPSEQPGMSHTMTLSAGFRLTQHTDTECFQYVHAMGVQANTGSQQPSPCSIASVLGSIPVVIQCGACFCCPSIPE